MQKYNTIDIDLNSRFPNQDKYFVERIMKLISLCPSNKLISIEDSNSKGYHIFLICNVDCDICRFVFDDDKRYMLDCDRCNNRQNIMFDRKHIRD